MTAGPQSHRTTRRLPVLLGVCWAIVALVTLVAVHDSPSRGPHHSPDEAAAEHATRLVRDTLRPAEVIPFDDPSGIARPRLWVRTEGRLIPAYPAATFYLFGLPARLPGGAWLRFLLPAAGLGALVAGVALLVPERRRWLAALTPGLAFPATYWLLRPWHNMSTVVALAGIALLGVALRVRSGRPAWLLLSLGAMTLATAIRPDHAHLLLGLSLVGAVAAADTRAERSRWLLWHVGGGVVAVAAVLVTNRLTVGSWVTSPVDLLDFPSEISPVGGSLPPGLRHLVLIFAPRGWPDWANVARQLGKYWLAFGAVAVPFAAAAAGLVAAWRTVLGAAARRGRLAASVALGALVVFAITRVSSTDWGAAFPDAAMNHSLPRYTALVYVGVAVAAVAAVAWTRRAVLASIGSGLLLLSSVMGLAVMYGGGQDQEALGWLRGQLDAGSVLEASVAEVVPEDGFLWMTRGDKFLWPVAPVGLLQHERPLTTDRIDFPRLTVGLVAAQRAGFESWLFEVTAGEAEVLEQLLAEHGLGLEATGYRPPPVPGFAHEPTWRVVERSAA